MVYRKWASGLAECVGTVVKSDANGDGTGGGLTYDCGFRFPFAFIEEPAVFYNIIRKDSYGNQNPFSCDTIYLSTERIEILICPPGPADTPSDYYASIQAVGRWRDLDFSKVTAQNYTEATLEEIENGYY